MLDGEFLELRVLDGEFLEFRVFDGEFLEFRVLDGEFLEFRSLEDSGEGGQVAAWRGGSNYIVCLCILAIV